MLTANRRHENADLFTEFQSRYQYGPPRTMSKSGKAQIGKHSVQATTNRIAKQIPTTRELKSTAIS